MIKYILFSLTGVILTGLCVYVALDMSFMHSEYLAQISTGELMVIKTAMRWSLVWVLLILLFAYFIINMFLYHHLMGPLYAIEKVLRMVADGDLTVWMPLRQGDELREVADTLEEMVGGIRRRLQTDMKKVDDVRQDLKKLSDKNPALKGDLDRLSETLSTVGQEFKLPR